MALTDASIKQKAESGTKANNDPNTVWLRDQQQKYTLEINWHVYHLTLNNIRTIVYVHTQKKSFLSGKIKLKLQTSSWIWGSFARKKTFLS